jgi:penicillin amidase
MAMRKILFAISTLVILSAPTFSQTVNLTGVGLKDTVNVRRDSRSIPYIEASNDGDLYFVQGYVTASDRLWQMDLLRRVARGETAEIFGKATLEEDKRWRRFGFAKVAGDSLSHLSPELRVALDAYARGVNAYIASLDERSLPIEFKILQYKPREWQAADSVVIGKILADALSSTWRNDLLRASLLNLPKEKIADLTNQVTPHDVVLFGKDVVIAERGVRNAETFDIQRALAASNAVEGVRRTSLERIGLYAEELAASNNWVISGKRTADGKPLLANDPHLLAAAPGIWYLSHLSTPKMRVSGVTFPGVPGIVLGHNEHIAWGATNVGPDVQDLYVETFDAAGKYMTPSGPATPVVRREEIRVRPNPLKPETEAVVLEVVETRNGPIILEQGGKKYALKWTARDSKNSEFEAFYFLNRSKNWRAFKNALRTYGGATQNFVYADVKGNIGWYAAGRIPVRKVGDGSLPYDGATDDGEWTGSIPFDRLPNLYNPSEGFIVTANQRIVGTSYRYPQISRDAASPWRARRLYDLLKTNPKMTMDDVSAAQMDAYNIPLARFAAEVVKLNAASQSTLDALKGWDGVMRPESRAAVIASEIRLCTAGKISAANPGVPAGLVMTRVMDYGVIAKRPEVWVPKPFTDYAALIRACEGELTATLEKKYGTDPNEWTWAAVSKARFPHPLAAAPLIGVQFATPTVGISGSRETPNVASFVSMRHIASPGNWDATRHVIPLGQSGDPRSPHYKDQFEAWRTGSPAVFPFSAAEVQKATVIQTTFSPASRP